MGLFLKTCSSWADFYYGHSLQLLRYALKGQILQLTTPLKRAYLSVEQIEFHRDFQVEHRDLIMDRSVFKKNKVDFLDKPVFLNLNKFLPLFQTFLTFNTAFATKKSPTHADFRLLYIITHGREVKFVNMTKLFNRWVNIYHLLVNIFLYRTNLMVFGSPIFKEELTALNWSLSSFKYRFFKYATPYFFFKDSSYGSQQSSTFFSLIHDLGYKILIMTNVRDLDKTVHYLKASDFYIIAPIPYNMSPWAVSFPIPVVVNNLFTQLFFLKFVTFSQQKAYAARFQIYNQHWLRAL